VVELLAWGVCQRCPPTGQRGLTRTGAHFGGMLVRGREPGARAGGRETLRRARAHYGSIAERVDGRD